MHKSNSTHATALLFQHRKRYGLHAMKTSSFLDLWFGGFNTASGMDCMQSASRCSRLPVCQVSIPQAVRIACNLKGVHYDDQVDRVSIPQAVRIACNGKENDHERLHKGFNTASGTDCMQ